MLAGRREHLLALLADGEFHSGETLARRLRMSRGGIWKLVQSLRGLGVELTSVPNRGYRLARPVDLLDRETILAALSAASRDRLERFELLTVVDSTNAFLAAQPVPPCGRASACVAEIQTHGRGRRGRTWMAPFGSGICLSISWQFATVPPTLPALSLAIGVAAARALHRCGADPVGVKWPNDLVWEHRKLGGILIEMRGESAGPAHVVVGIGINTHLPAAVRLALAGQQAALVADLRDILRERTPARSALVGVLLDECIDTLQVFGERGFEHFRETWASLDSLANTPVKVITGAQTVLGIARGVAEDGTLLVEVDGALRRFVSGEVSVRAF